MATATANPTFSRGGDAAQEADEAARAAGGFRKTHYLPKIGPGKQIFIRYITDSPDWIYAKAHPSAPTKNAPADWPKERKWPESMPAVCRYDTAFAEIKDDATGEILRPAIHTDCYICDAKLTNQWGRACNPVIRVWALAVLREEVLGTQAMVGEGPGKIPAEKVGKRVGFRDATREVKVVGPDGKETDQTETELALIVVNQAVSNYFGGLQSAYDAFGTVCDRDYILKQNGDGKDVDYVHMPVHETPALQPGTEKWKRYTDAVEKQEIDLTAMLVDRASDDFFALFFDPNKEAPKRTKKDGEADATPGAASTNQQAAAPSSDVDPGKLEAMRARLRGGSTTAAEAAPGDDAPADDAPATEAAPAAPAAAAAASSVDYD